MYTTKEISVYGTEQEFITTFVNELVSADDRITCQTDIAEEFASTENNPNIMLNIAGVGFLQLSRGSALSNGTQGYTFNLLINGIKKVTALLNFNGNSVASNKYNSVITRTWKFIAHKQNGFQIVKIYNYQLTFNGNCNLYFVSINEENMNLCLANGSTNSGIKFDITGEFVRTDDTAKGIVYRISTRINYKCYDGSVEIIKNKAFTTSNILAYTFDGFYDCSYVPAGSVVTVDSENYIAIDEHTLAKI